MNFPSIIEMVLVDGPLRTILEMDGAFNELYEERIEDGTVA